MTPSTCCHPDLEFGYIIDFCSCWMNFIVSLKEKGDGILHHCPASFCLRGQFTESKLNFVQCHFPPFQINDLGSLMRVKHQLTILWPVSRL